MDVEMLSRKERRAYDFVVKSGAVTRARLKSVGIEVRFANSLVACGLLAWDGKSYRDAQKKAPEAKEEVTEATGGCLCGCGAELAAKRRFAQGHDAKLHSIVLKVARGQAAKSTLPATSTTVAYLRGAPWMTAEIRQAIGL